MRAGPYSLVAATLPPRPAPSTASSRRAGLARGALRPCAPPPPARAGPVRVVIAAGQDRRPRSPVPLRTEGAPARWRRDLAGRLAHGVRDLESFEQRGPCGERVRRVDQR